MLVPTWGAGVTAAAGTSLTTPYSPYYLHMAKAHALHEHLESPYHTFVHCKGFAPVAPRRAKTSV